MNSDIKALVRQLTLDEKAALCCGKSAWETLPIERLGIPSIVMVRRSPDMASSSLRLEKIYQQARKLLWLSSLQRLNYGAK